MGNYLSFTNVPSFPLLVKVGAVCLFVNTRHKVQSDFFCPRKDNLRVGGAGLGGGDGEPQATPCPVCRGNCNRSPRLLGVVCWASANSLLLSNR